MPQNKLLRYEIDSWDQVVECLSNNSKHLHLTCDEVMDTCLTGTVVRVEHDKYGCLFSYLVHGSGNLLTSQPDGMMFELTTDQVLDELYKYGFVIKFSTQVVLDDDQFGLLVTTNELGFDKIRIMYVDLAKPVVSKGRREYVRKANLVAFKVSDLPRWLDNTKVCTSDEFSRALISGSAVNLTRTSGGLQGHNWGFLVDKVLSVEDVLSNSR